MNVTITGVGLWTRGLRSWADLLGLLDGAEASSADFVAPRAEAITARERRRAGLTINLAVEAAHQACAMAGADRSSVGSVFASAMGDTDITDYMCRKLVTNDKLLSPTRFHNSVHNAASGYWTISAGNRQPSSFVGGFLDSFACGLLEAASSALAYDQPFLLCAYDIADAPPFHDILRIDESLGLALALVPGVHKPGWPVAITVEAGAACRPMPVHGALASLAAANPMGTGLALLERLAKDDGGAMIWPVGNGSRLRVVPISR